jgi:hypothetical protein
VAHVGQEGALDLVGLERLGLGVAAVADLLLELAVGLRQGDRPLLDALLELVAGVAELLLDPLALATSRSMRASVLRNDAPPLSGG